MSERENDGTPTNEPQDDGVALSPYDSDLRPAEEEPVTGDLDLRTPEGYDEPIEIDEGTVDEAPMGETEGIGSTAVEPDVEKPVSTDEADTGPATETMPQSEEDAVEATLTTENAEDEFLDSRIDEPASDEAPDGEGEPATTALPVGAADDDPLSDTAVRRTSLLRPSPYDEQPSNEPVALRESTEADPRVEKYGTQLDDADLFEGAVYDKVPSRAGAHVLSLLAFLILVPIAWYLLSDAGARMTLPENAQWTTGTMSIAPFGELLGGLIVLVAIFWAARGSSLGPWVMGTLLTLFGGMFVIVPGIAKDLVDGWREPLRSLHEGLGGNIHHHLSADGSTGRLLVFGVLLLLTGLVGHSARRKGMEEQRIRQAVERRKARTGTAA